MFCPGPFQIFAETIGTWCLLATGSTEFYMNTAHGTIIVFFYALMLTNFGLLRLFFLIKTGVQGFLHERSQVLFYFLATKNAQEAHAKRVQESIIVHCDKIVLVVKVFSTQTKNVYIAMFWHNARNTV